MARGGGILSIPWFRHISMYCVVYRSKEERVHDPIHDYNVNDEECVKTSDCGPAVLELTSRSAVLMMQLVTW